MQAGGDTEANADYTTAQGFHTVANSMYQSVRGLYNEIDSGGKYLDIDRVRHIGRVGSRKRIRSR